MCGLMCSFDNQIIAYTVHTQHYTVAVEVVDSDRLSGSLLYITSW